MTNMITAESLRNYLTEHRGYPAGIEIADIMWINHGWECDIIRFSAILPGEATHNYILRAYTGKTLPMLPDKPNNEYVTMKRLGKDGFPVPQVHWLETNADIFGNPFLVMDYIDGELLGVQYDNADAITQQQLFELFTGIFVRLHSLDWRWYIDNAREITTKEAVADKLDWLAGISDYFGADVQPGLEWLRQQAGTVKPGKTSLIHWDLHSNNIIMSAGQPYVLDWTMAEVTDCRFDLAWSLLFLEGLGPRFIERYSQLAGIDITDMDFFLSFAYLRRLLSVVISIEHGAEALGMRPGAENLMRRQKESLINLYLQWVKTTGAEMPHIQEALSAL